MQETHRELSSKPNNQPAPNFSPKVDCPACTNCTRESSWERAPSGANMKILSQCVYSALRYIHSVTGQTGNWLFFTGWYESRTVSGSQVQDRRGKHETAQQAKKQILYIHERVKSWTQMWQKSQNLILTHRVRKVLQQITVFISSHLKEIHCFSL